MIIVGAENLEEKLKAEPLRQHKAILNEKGMVIFCVSQQHSMIKVHGISYQDDSKGNALAAIFNAQKFEIRGHNDFTTNRVKSLVEMLRRAPELSALRNHQVTYQGMTIG
jgi:hypothetical protein